jgi:signal peptidase II
MGKLFRLLQNNRRNVVFSLIAAIVITADQLTKAWIRHTLAPGEILWDKGFLQIIHVKNTGASFGILTGHTWVVIAAVFIEIAVVLVFVYLLHKRLAFLDSMFLRVGIGLILGGAIGNQIDRLAFGQVTDFIDFKWWPVWNVADGSAVIGAIIIAVCIIFFSGRGKSKA